MIERRRRLIRDVLILDMLIFPQIPPMIVRLSRKGSCAHASVQRSTRISTQLSGRMHLPPAPDYNEWFDTQRIVYPFTTHAEKMLCDTHKIFFPFSTRSSSARSRSNSDLL